MIAAVAGVEPAVDDGRRRRLGLVPVALHHDVAAGQQLAVVGGGHLHAQDGRAGPAQLDGPLAGVRSSHSARRRAIVRMGDVSVSPYTCTNSHPSSVSIRSMVRVGGGAPATAMRTGAGAGHRPVPRGGGIEHGGRHRRRPAQQGDAMGLDAPQDLGPVHLAQHDVGAAHAGDGEGHAPAVGVEHRQGVEVHVAVAHAHVPAELGGVEPAVAVGQLHALGPRRRAARVVDGGGGVLVGPPTDGARRRSAAAPRRWRRRARSGARPSRPTAPRPARGRRAATRAPECSTM